MEEKIKPINNLHRAIKNHVFGKEKEFFIATQIGFEQACFNEFTNFFEDAKILEGGIEFKGKFTDCYFLNLHSRIASKILMRIDKFKASNFNSLEKKISKINWEVLINKYSDILINITSKKSRLYHKDAIEESIKNGILERFKNVNIRLSGQLNNLNSLNILEQDEIKEKIFVRVVNDEFTISLDTSGELLHKRQVKNFSCQATIRENIASFILQLANYKPDKPLIDPMFGSGTFPIEASMISQNIPAGFFRRFAFMNWQSFNAKTWNYLKSKAQKNFISANNKIFALDKNKLLCEQFNETINQNDFLKNIEVFNKNFFDFKPTDLTQEQGLIVINPPYGERIGTKSDSRILFLEICKNLKSKYKNWQVALICPDLSFTKFINFKAKYYWFLHGGTKRILALGKITA